MQTQKLLALSAVVASVSATSCSQAPPQICKSITFVFINVDEPSSRLFINGQPVPGLMLQPTDHGMPEGTIDRKLCGRSNIRFAAGAVDVSAEIEVGERLGVIYVDPTSNPVIRATDHTVPMLD